MLRATFFAFAKRRVTAAAPTNLAAAKAASGKQGAATKMPKAATAAAAAAATAAPKTKAPKAGSARALAKAAAEAAAAKAAALSQAQAPWWAPLPHRHLVVLVDGHAMLYRCFAAYEASTAVADRNEASMAVWAKRSVRAYVATLQRLRPPGSESVEGLHYDVQLITLLDGGAYSRAAALPSYKSNREAIRRPEIDQFITFGMEGLRKMTHIDVVPKQRGDFPAEADDLIYTLVKRCRSVPNTDVIVASHDKDLFQLIDTAHGVYFYNLRSRCFFDEAAVLTKLGVLPSQIQDYLSLLGDVSDAIPGVVGLGKVRAAKLLQMHGSMDAIFAKAKEGTLTGVPPNIANGILPFKEQAYKMRNEVVALQDIPQVMQQLTLRCEAAQQAASSAASSQPLDG